MNNNERVVGMKANRLVAQARVTKDRWRCERQRSRADSQEARIVPGARLWINGGNPLGEP
jgi:hypothetical protein